MTSGGLHRRSTASGEREASDHAHHIWIVPAQPMGLLYPAVLLGHQQYRRLVQAVASSRRHPDSSLLLVSLLLVLMPFYPHSSKRELPYLLMKHKRGSGRRKEYIVTGSDLDFFSHETAQNMQDAACRWHLHSSCAGGRALCSKPLARSYPQVSYESACRLLQVVSPHRG